MDTLEKQFDAVMWNIYEEAKMPSSRHNAIYFFRELIQYGGLETARRLLEAAEVQKGFTQLVSSNRIDLTVEFQVLQPRFKELFTEKERKAAMQRLNSIDCSVDNEGKLIRIKK
jgi:hypothetical protein